MIKVKMTKYKATFTRKYTDIKGEVKYEGLGSIQFLYPWTSEVSVQGFAFLRATKAQQDANIVEVEII